MHVSYTRPLSAAWTRTKAMLFARPFPIEAWFVTGFSAWLAEIFANTGNGLGSSWRSREHLDFGDLPHVVSLFTRPAVLAGIAAVLAVVLVLALVLSWVSARAQFVFLENVVRGRAAFTEPWKRSARLGTSLFLWHAAMSFSWLLPLACVAVPLVPIATAVYAGGAPPETLAPGVLIGCCAALLCAFVLTAIYVLNDNFVVPLMWKHDEGAAAAWGRFGTLLAAHAGDFGAYVAFVFVLAIGTGIAVVLAGLLTCCVGLVLVMIPYLGVVAMLPVYFTFRALGPEFLRQYGAEWDLWAEREVAPDDAALPPIA